MTLPTAIDRAKEQPGKIATLKKHFIRLHFYHQHDYGGKKMINKENYINNIPQELKERKQWLWFKIYHNKDKNGNIKMVKIPMSPITCESNELNK